jgi:hypothetical protein
LRNSGEIAQIIWPKRKFSFAILIAIVVPGEKTKLREMDSSRISLAAKKLTSGL